MHATMEDLIALRDGRSSPAVDAHVGACPACSKEFERLVASTEALRDIPECEAARDLWPALSAALTERRKMRMAKVAWGLSAAAAAMIIGLVLVVGVRIGPGHANMGAGAPQKAAVAPVLQPLVKQSQRLEAALTRLDQGSSVVSGGTAGVIAGLQDQVAIVDLQISLLDQSKDDDQLERLWKERVRLLSTLLEVRTGRGQVAAL
jgi:anti-sigma factor RsiW